MLTGLNLRPLPIVGISLPWKKMELGYSNSIKNYRKNAITEDKWKAWVYNWTFKMLILNINIKMLNLWVFKTDYCITKQRWWRPWNLMMRRINLLCFTSQNSLLTLSFNWKGSLPKMLSIYQFWWVTSFLLSLENLSRNKQLHCNKLSITKCLQPCLLFLQLPAPRRRNRWITLMMTGNSTKVIDNNDFKISFELAQINLFCLYHFW